MSQQIQVFELPALGIRVFRTVPSDDGFQEDMQLTYYTHKHPYFEVHIILSGELLFQVGAHGCKLVENSFCLVYPGIVHAPASDITGVNRVCLGFELTDPAGKMARLLQGKMQNAGYAQGSSRELSTMWNSLRNEKIGNLFHGDMMISLLTQLMITLARVMEESASEAMAVEGDLDQLRTVYIDTFLNNRFFLTAGEGILAEKLGISRRQLDRIFQKLYGKSYRKKRMEVRGAAACDMLKGSIPIREIAERVGYGSSSNFTAFFKGLYGITPSQYRHQWKKTYENET